MMTVVDKTRYQQYRMEKETRSPAVAFYQEILLPILLFGSMGAITWAIRGTHGWNGVDGTILPGLTLGLLWYYLCFRKGIDARATVLWFGMGLAIGGELGYGQYVSWIRGMFEVAEGTIPIAPGHGYLWLVYCGIGWAAPGAIALGWALSRRASTVDWILRVVLAVIVVALAYWPVVNLVGKFFVAVCPTLLFPFYGTGIYDGEMHSHLERTIYANSQNFAFVLWWIAALAVAAVRRDKATVWVGLVVGGGFGPVFFLSTLWCLGYSYAPSYVDWWKMWELSAGFGLGMLCVIALWWANEQVNKRHDSQGNPIEEAGPKATPVSLSEWRQSAASLPFLCITLIFTFMDGFLLTALFLAASYVVVFCITWFGAKGDAMESRARASLAFSVFLLLFILLRGATSMTGVVVEFYDIEATNQYAWPTPRIIMFVPIAILLVVSTLAYLWKHVLPASVSTPDANKIGIRMADLMTLTGIVGAVSIWPAKIGILYAVCICVAFFAFNRINRAFDHGDHANAIM